jgi:hypothetical protein
MTFEVTRDLRSPVGSLRQTLPKDFEALLATGDFARITEALEACEPEARGTGSPRGSTRTALMYKGCSDELTRWLLARGASLDARDRYQNTVLQSRITCGGELEVLFALGVDVNAVGGAGGTALHTAATMGKAKVVRRLLSAGAKVDAVDRYRKTALEASLERAHNAALPQVLEVAQLLLAAGAERRPSMQAAVKRLGETFEFTRSGFDRELLPEASAALEQLYATFGVTPVPPRVMHDGVSRITMKAAQWEGQFAELWALLIPPSGAAATVQGEVIRIAGRMADEVHRNGGANWDDRYRAMAKALIAHLGSGVSIHEKDLADVRTLLRGPPGDDDVDELKRFAVVWVRSNPMPVALAKPDYAR